MGQRKERGQTVQHLMRRAYPPERKEAVTQLIEQAETEIATQGPSRSREVVSSLFQNLGDTAQRSYRSIIERIGSATLLLKMG